MRTLIFISLIMSTASTTYAMNARTRPLDKAEEAPFDWKRSKLVAYRECTDPVQQERLFGELHSVERELVLLTQEELVHYILKMNIGELRPYARELIPSLQNWSPLHTATAFGDALDCSGRVKIDARNRMQQTPLHIAVIFSNRGAATALLAQGARIDCTDLYGNTPLCVAAAQGDADFIAQLCKRGASRVHTNFNGETPLHRVMHSRSRQALESLTLKRDADLTQALRTYDKQNQTPLHIACKIGWLEGVRHLLTLGAPLNLRHFAYLASTDGYTDRSGRTALHQLCSVSKEMFRESHLEIARALLEKGASPATWSGDGMTPVLSAVLNRHTALVRLLVKYNADMKVASHFCYTVLHGAVHTNDAAFVYFCVTHGAPVNPAPDDVLVSQLASRIQHLAPDAPEKCINFLATHKAHIHPECLDDLIEILESHGIALSQGQAQELVRLVTPEIHTLIVRPCASPLHVACTYNALENARALVTTCGADVNAIDPHSSNIPLHCAVGAGSLDLVTLLVGSKATIDVQGGNARTPLHMACAQGLWGIANFLISKGASQKRTDRNGDTAADVAYRNSQWELLEEGNQTQKGTARLHHALGQENVSGKL